MNQTEFFEHMSIAPPGQLDVSVLPKMKEFAKRSAHNEKIRSDELLEVLDDCACYALASEFVMNILNIKWNELLKEENKTVQQAIEEAKERRSKRVI